MKERRKIRSKTRKERKEKVDRTHPCKPKRLGWKKGKKESKRTKRLQSTHMYAGDYYCLNRTFEPNRPVKSPEALCGKCTNLKK